MVADHPLKERPQPIDYGLTYDDLNLYENVRAWQAEAEDDKGPKRFPTAEQVSASIQREMGHWVMGTRGTRPDDVYKPGRRWFGFWRFIIPGLSNRLRQSPSPELQAYWQALDAHDKAKLAAEKAAHDAELRKRSYWEFLDGYEFERATAEVLKKHQFNPVVTSGSADGGIDIEVTRNGLKGVVQCKAHVASVGPHVVRDLYGVIHHCGANFGIIVSRGGFSKGAIDFARDKPILFLDVSELIAMQEGQDVLAAAFAGSSPDTGS